MKFQFYVFFLAFVSAISTINTSAQIHDPRALDSDPATATGPLAPKLKGLGDHHIKVTTSNDDSQYFFDQGYRLTLGFNHSEALRAFKEAVRLDPGNAMAYWGIALVLGPNLNLPMQPNVVEQAFKAIQKALSLKGNVSAWERDYIETLASRYDNNPQSDHPALGSAYVDAMAKLVAKYPDDLDAATLYAAAIMNTNPWDYWYKDGTPKASTKVALATLRSVIKRNPKHAGAHHYLIHLVEAFRPELGEASANVLAGLMPGAGHLVHMPSHIFMRVGRYADSYNTNVLATQVDEDYITQCQSQGLYPLGYYPHNIHFLVWSAMFQGRSQVALDSARKIVSKIPVGSEDNVWRLYETYLSQPVFALVRFGRWDELLAEPQPEKTALYMNAVWRYGRAMAYTHKGNTRSAKKELKRLLQLKKLAKNNEHYNSPYSKTIALLNIAEETLTGEIAARKGKFYDAIAHLQRAVRLQDGLRYNEPPDWYFPVRHFLGAVLMEAGLPAEAEVVYWEDLRRNPENGYSLFGLKQSLLAQGKNSDAKMIDQRLTKAWANADVQLNSSRY